MVRIDYDTQAYWKGCAEKKLIIAQCNSCSKMVHPPKIMCPVCWSEDIKHVEMPGDAEVLTYTAIPQRDGSEPKVTVWAQLKGTDVVVLGELQAGYGEIECGDPLTLTWNPLEDTTVPGFIKGKK